MLNKLPHSQVITKYILEGRVVTMGAAGILPIGAIYVDSGEIMAVSSTTCDPPAGFENAPYIRTKGTIYPGLMELHNHLCYNAMPRWKVSLLYQNCSSWRSANGDYARLVMKPTQVLGASEGVVEALIRFVECKCLLSGVTTSQGITLSSEPGIVSVFDGLIRNVERPEDPLPAAGTKIGNPAKDKAAEYLDNLNRHTCYLQHLSEGIDDTARGWFLNLQMESGAWAINDKLCGIHNLALTSEDMHVLGANGGSMVWSPLSNFLLYGRTADVQAAKEAGLLMGIGSDWAPTGSRNLLGELKIAWLASHNQQSEDPIFSAKELVAMATINAARILKWQHMLGSIETGKRADIMVLEGRTEDDYMRVIGAVESDITLVIVDGIPRVGDERLMRALGLQAENIEEIKIGGHPRWLYLTQQYAHPLVRNLRLSVAVDRLRDALHRLPELAQQMDVKRSIGYFSGSFDDAGVPWRILLDFEEDPADRILAAIPMAQFSLEPMELEELTCVDDAQYIPSLMESRNLPESIKATLPSLFAQ